MIRFILFAIVFLATLKSFSQDTIFVRRPVDWISGSTNYTTDTTLIASYRDRLVMAGTTIIPNTVAQYRVDNDYQLWLESVSEPICISDREIDNGKDYIKTVSETDTTLTVATIIHENCCYQFLCDVSTNENGIVNLSYIAYGHTRCGCMCVFMLNYTFKKSEYAPEKELKGFTINQNPATLKNYHRK